MISNIGLKSSCSASLHSTTNTVSLVKTSSSLFSSATPLNFSFKISKHPSCLVLVKAPSRLLVSSTNPIPSAPSSHLHSFQNLSQNFQNLSRETLILGFLQF